VRFSRQVLIIMQPQEGLGREWYTQQLSGGGVILS